jgi:hypothetical protein
MKYLAFLFLSLSCSLLLAETEWKDSTVIKISTTNEWCRHCPDWNQTSYSFKLDDGTVFVAQTHEKLDITLNGRTKLRFEKDGHVGDHVHILDDAGKDQKLRITEKIAVDRRPADSRTP